MKKSLLAIGLALASTPFMFAAPQASTTAPAAKTTTTQKTKKHAKKGHKATKATKPAAK